MKRIMALSPTFQELKTGWKRYGFVSENETEMYAGYIVKSALDSISRGSNEAFGLLTNTPQRLLEIYPLEEFRKGSVGYD